MSILDVKTANTISVLEKQITEELDFEKLSELCEHLTNAVCEILNSCGMYFRIFSRVKSSASIAEKIERGKYGTEENPKKLQDLIGLRVVLYYYDDLSICRNIMESTFRMIDDWSRSKYNADEFRATKINGVFHFPEEYFHLYKKELWSLPIDTTFEIQFRTVFFEGWHEIEHDMRYKSFLSDDEFWKGSEELSRILNCILANLELSDWSLVQLFDQLAYNHYKRANWELMLKSKYRIKISEIETLDSRITEIFNQDRKIAKQFFKGSRKELIKELLKLDNPHLNYNLIIKLLNERIVHNEQIAAICDAIAPIRDERVYQKNALARLESNILFHLELPLLHKETRKLQSEFNNASSILYKWTRFKLNPVFEDMPSEVCSYQNHLPGYDLDMTYAPEEYKFSLKIRHIDNKNIGTLWNFDASITRSEEGRLFFRHITSCDMPRGVSQRSTFNKPSFLSDLSNKVGIVDVTRLGAKPQFVADNSTLEDLTALIHTHTRRLPVVVITQHTKSSSQKLPVSYTDYDMTTFTINGMRLAKVVGHYCHVAMLDYDIVERFALQYDISENPYGCIAIFWRPLTEKSAEIYTKNMVIHTQFDFNRFAFYDETIYEKAFRHKLVQMIKDNNIKS